MAQKAEGADTEDTDEYRAASIFCVPKEARWSFQWGKLTPLDTGEIGPSTLEGTIRAFIVRVNSLNYPVLATCQKEMMSSGRRCDLQAIRYRRLN